MNARLSLCARTVRPWSRVGLAGANWAQINASNNGVGYERRNCACEQTLRWNFAHSKYFQVCCEHAQCFQRWYLKAERPEVEPTTSESRVQRHNHYTTGPLCTVKIFYSVICKPMSCQKAVEDEIVATLVIKVYYSLQLAMRERSVAFINVGRNRVIWAYLAGLLGASFSWTQP